MTTTATSMVASKVCRIVGENDHNRVVETFSWYRIVRQDTFENLVSQAEKLNRAAGDLHYSVVCEKWMFFSSQFHHLESWLSFFT